MDVTRASERWSHRLATWLTRPRLTFFFAAFFLAQLGLFLYSESVPGMLDRGERVKGRDFLQFYLAGYLVACGESDRLYDQDYFFATQLTFVRASEYVPRYPSVYPPSVALLFAPLGALPYEQAVLLWWLFQLALFGLAAGLLYRLLRPAPRWRATAVLGFAGFYPVLNTFWNGQLAALLLPVLVFGLLLRTRARPIAAGLVWSLLALKPQLMLATGLWLLIRRDWRVILGVGLGGAFQVTVVAALLGPDVLLAYPTAARVIDQWFRLYTMAPDHQHALAGILTTYLGADHRYLATAVQLAVAAVGAWWLYRIRRGAPALEFAAAVPFLLLAIPHLLTYDLSYLLASVAALLALSRGRPGLLTPAVLLYATATLAPLYTFLGFSLMPAALLAALYVLSRYAEDGGGGVGHETTACPRAVA